MNISVSELLLVVLIALLVIRPEQMPEVALMLGRLARSIRLAISKVKNEVNVLIDPIEKTNERQ